MYGLSSAGLLAILSFVIYRRLRRQQPLLHAYQPHPAQTYAEALERLQPLQAVEAELVNLVCRTQLLTHGHKTPKAIVFLHGFTNCPNQFCQLAEQFHRCGYNVLNTRLPYHGFTDRLTTALTQLTAEEMVTLTSEVLDIAHGFGEQVTLLGFSLGGVLAGWAAQERADLDCAVLVSPALGLHALSPAHSLLAANALATLPNFFRWWDAKQKAAKIEPLHAYPRYPSRGLAALIRLGCLVQDAAKAAKPVARAILLITNPCDQVVDNQVALAVAKQWLAHGAAVQTYAFPQEWHLVHDLMDPAQPGQQVARVYPLLLNWIDSGLPSSS